MDHGAPPVPLRPAPSRMEQSHTPILRAQELPEAPPPGAVRTACVQMEPRITETARNVDATIADLARARETGATLAVFPEASLTGYCFRDAGEARAHALALDGPELRAVADACAQYDIAAVVGFIERTGTGLANTAAVVRPDRSIDAYHKTHLPHLGVDRWVEAGCGPLEPLVAAGLQLGLLICYDASFPEASRTLALRGAELLVLPTNWPAEAVVKADWLPNTRAYENVVYFAAVNRVGEERGFVFHGRSRICGPTGDTLVQGPADAPAMLLADVYPERARQKRIERRGSDYWVDRIAHRREDLYDLRALPERGGDGRA